MLAQHDRAFKEWAVVCEAMREGRQILLVRKGGISEDEGVFRMDDTEFFLLPTYEHQKAELLQAGSADRLAAIQAAAHDPREIRIGSYAVVDTIAHAKTEEQVNALAGEYIWNSDYVRMRFDFNPYDPLYLVVLRVYNLPTEAVLPMRREYEGCKSWVTLDRALPTAGATPALTDAEFARRRDEVLRIIA